MQGLTTLLSVISSLVDELVAAGALAGKLQAGGATWVPAVHARTQGDSARAFFAQNGFIGCVRFG